MSPTSHPRVTLGHPRNSGAHGIESPDQPQLSLGWTPVGDVDMVSSPNGNLVAAVRRSFRDS